MRGVIIALNNFFYGNITCKSDFLGYSRIPFPEEGTVSIVWEAIIIANLPENLLHQKL